MNHSIALVLFLFNESLFLFYFYPYKIPPPSPCNTKFTAVITRLLCGEPRVEQLDKLLLCWLSILFEVFRKWLHDKAKRSRERERTKHATAQTSWEKGHAAAAIPLGGLNFHSPLADVKRALAPKREEGRQLEEIDD